MTKAKHEGIPLAAVLKFATKAFVSGDLKVGLIGSETFNTQTAREVANALKDIFQDKNLSPGFTSAKDAIKFLKA